MCFSGPRVPRPSGRLARGEVSGTQDAAVKWNGGVENGGPKAAATVTPGQAARWAASASRPPRSRRRLKAPVYPVRRARLLRGGC